MSAYQDWLAGLEKQVEEGKLTTEQKNDKIARALLARDLWAERFKKIAYKDRLTGLPNNRAFTIRIEQLSKGGDPYGLLIVDIDHFKKTNDLYGHSVGDNVLFQVGQTLVTNLRIAREYEKDDLVTRYGGEEFAILLPGVKNPQDLEKVAERLRANLADNPILTKVAGQPETIPVTISIGGGISTGENPQEFFHKVDTLGLYAAKNTGRNRSVIISS